MKKALAFCSVVVLSAIAFRASATDIATASEFTEQLTADPSGNYTLTADIDFGGTQTTLDSFSGTLDGAGHSITGLQNPLIETLSGTVKELKVHSYTAYAKNVFPTTQYINRGIIANVATDGAVLDHITVSNCTFVSARTVTQYIGGLVGHVTEATDAGVLIKDSIVVECAIGSTGAPSGGGFVGASEHCVLTISRCELIDSAITGQYAAGILSRPDFAGSTNNITGCIVGGTISSTQFAGGICCGGWTTVATANGPSVINISRCRNNATITAFKEPASNTAAGGMYATTYRNGIYTITDCENHGSISGCGMVDSDRCGIGGIFGGALGNTGGAPTPITILRCVNYGDITATYQGAGGILGGAGSTSSSPIIHYVANYGKITAGDYAGGILGRCLFDYQALELCNAANYGDVESTGDGSSAGGIAGAFGGNHGIGTQSNVLSVASVSAPGSAGAYIGYSWHPSVNASVTLKNCWLAGSLSAVTTGFFNASAASYPARTLTFAVDARCRTAVTGVQHSWYDQAGVVHDVEVTAMPSGALTDGTATAALGPDWEQGSDYPHMKFEGNCAPEYIAYNVVFQDYDESLIGATQSVIRCGAAVAPPDPVRANYAFTGWSPSDFSFVDHDMVITATYESLLNTHLVTFRDWDNSLVVQVEVNDGDPVASRSGPVRTGYEFAAWTLDSVPYDFSAPVTADITLVASYTIRTYPVTFLDWNGHQIGSVQQVEYLGSAVAPTLPPLPEGTRFLHWDCAFDSITAPLTVTAVIISDHVYVSTTGTDDAGHGSADHPFKTIGYAVETLGTAGGTIEVFPGTYTISQQISLSAPICVRRKSGEEGEVVVRHNRSGATYGAALRVFSVLNEDASVVGLTLENGWVSCADSGKGGGAVYMTSGMISNCVVRGSVALQTSGTYPYGGGIHVNGDSAIVTHCVVSNCQTKVDAAWAGKCAAGIHVVRGVAENCLVADCYTSTEISSPTQERVIGGMAVNNNTGSKIVNCTVVGCYGSACGGIFSYGANALVVNCVVFDCEKRVSGTVASDAFDGTAQSFCNCAADVGLPAGAIDCIGGIDESAFMDYASGNFTPKPLGPLYNAGSGVLGSHSAFDLSGLKRVVKVIDIGAFESQYIPGFVITGKRID